MVDQSLVDPITTPTTGSLTAHLPPGDHMAPMRGRARGQASRGDSASDTSGAAGPLAPPPTGELTSRKANMMAPRTAKMAITTTTHCMVGPKNEFDSWALRARVARPFGAVRE